MRKFRLAALTLVALAAIPGFGQNTDIESLSGLQFTFGNPGARALGMGGAFLGLADDASAAEANPAGLTILRKMEVSLEVRNFRAEQSAQVGGVFPNIETQNFSTFSRTAEVSFASVVFPKGNFAAAVYYHSPISYTNDFAVINTPNFFLTRGTPPGSGGPVTPAECFRIQETDPAGCTQYALFPYESLVDIKLKTWGLAGAWKSGPFSLGAAVRYHQFDELAATFRTDFQGNIQSVVLQGQLKDLRSQNLVVETETDITYSAGFKWTPSERISVGGVYKVGPSFDEPVFAANFASGGEFQRQNDVQFNVPSVAGLGVSLHPLATLTINVDAVNVQYSDLVDDFRPANIAIQLVDNPYEAKDITEIHVGGEYFFATKIPVAIRAGYWSEPAHSTRYAGPTTCTDEIIREDERPLCAAIRFGQTILFPKSEDQDHMSLGIGLAWPNFQIDAAYDTADQFKVGSISAVFRF